MATPDEILTNARTHWAAGRSSEAEATCHFILNAAPDHAESLAFMSEISRTRGRYAVAAILAREAIRAAPCEARHHLALGKAWMEMGLNPEKVKKAVEAFRAAIALDPESAETYDWLGLALRDGGHLEQAIGAHRKALELDPDFLNANANLACVLMPMGRLDEAMRFHRRAVELVPGHIVASDNLLLCAQYRPGVSLEELSTLHREWQHRVITPMNIPIPEHPQERDPEKRLRIGFVSYDFGRHPVGYFLLPLLRGLNPSQVETVCYSDRINTDDLTMKLREASDFWVETSALNHKDLAQRIFDDRIDILFDLAGHTAKSRLISFAYKPAPIQMTWAGYVGTTGLETMDYLLADHLHTPEGHDERFSEQVLRLPDIYVSVYPPDGAPEVGPLPAGEDDAITFGSFSIPTKINSGVIDVWARIMQEVPESRLILMYTGMDDEGNRRRLEDSFANHDIAPERLDIRGPVPHVDLLETYTAEVDIALDTFPYSGGLTTCEALWMGVPVITRPGETFASRHSFAYLSVVGLQDLIADSQDDYIENAVSLAKDRDRLAAIRSTLRERMKASPLLDGNRFANHFTDAMRTAWKRWCATAPVHPEATTTPEKTRATS